MIGIWLLSKKSYESVITITLFNPFDAIRAKFVQRTDQHSPIFLKQTSRKLQTFFNQMCPKHCRSSKKCL